MEAETQITIAHRLKYCTKEVHDVLLDLMQELGKQLNALKSALRRRLSTLAEDSD